VEGPQSKPVGNITLIAFLVTAFVGGFNIIGVHFSNEELPPFWGAAIRFGLAGGLFIIYALVRGIPWPSGTRGWAGPVLNGVFGFGLGYAFVYWSLLEVTPAVGQLFLSLAPLLTLLLAIVHRIERFRWQSLLGSLLAVAGMAIIIRNQLDLNVPLGPLLALLAAAACIAESSVVLKFFPRNHPALTNGIGMGVGAILLYAFSRLSSEFRVIPMERTTYLALGYLVVIGSVGLFILFLFVLNRWTASATSYLFLLMPFTSMLGSIWLTGEKITPSFIIGGIVILVGVYWGAIRKPKHPVPAPPGAPVPEADSAPRT
jgi:drug/metabolite transporter (DMT)-like permease